MEIVYVALGSNVGDRQGALDLAIAGLRATPGVEGVRVSSWVETQFVGDGPEQGPFLNGVVELRTSLGPPSLLGVLRALEQAAGRQFPHAKNHPRELDLDIIFFGDRCIDSKELQVPHPRWHEREFVTAPLQELGVAVSQRPRARGVELIEDGEALSERVASWLEGGCVIGLVPTMGSLHEGHASLMRRAREECDRVLVTVFVNPLQFGPSEDFAAYPRDLDGDVAVCAATGVDAVFAPDSEQMYGADFCSHVSVGIEAVEMEGALREGHFVGVATVVARLFAMTNPHRAYFGEKDAQQLAVVRRMSAELGFAAEVVACPIVREPDGLAMSSRNRFLTAEDRAAAGALYRALAGAREQFARGLRDRDALLESVRATLSGEPRFRLEYVELRRERDLRPLPAGDVDGGRLLVAAAFDGGDRAVRLLDNMLLQAEGER